MNGALVLTTGGLPGVDLGRLDPACRASYHGTYPAYVKGKCRCPHARESYRVYKKRLREGRHTPVMVDATGARRRVQGMWALGHPSPAIAAECDGKLRAPQVIRSCHQDFITPRQHDLIVGAYRVLINRQGSSVRLRNMARVAGWALPVQWGTDIDDPAAVPEPLEPEPDTGEVDEAAIEMALSGRPEPLTDQELIAAVQMGSARGLGPWTLAPLLGVDARVVRRLAVGDVPPRLGAIARRRTAQLGGRHEPRP